MKKYIFRIISVLLLMVGFVLIYNGFNYIITDNTGSRTRVQFADYENQDQVDLLYEGTSHFEYGINAERISEDLDETAFNMGTSAQDFIGGYYLLQECLEEHPEVKHVYYEFSLSRLSLKEGNAMLTLSTYVIADYLKDPVKRFKLITSVFGTSGYINGFSTLRRNIDATDLPELEDFEEVLEKKSTDDYKNKVPYASYSGLGQWASKKQITTVDTLALNLKTVNQNNFSADVIQQKEWNYFVKIMEYCKKKNVELTIVIPPYHEYYLMVFDDYNKITELAKAEMEEQGVDVLDCNLIKEEYLDLENSDFMNIDHVNEKGSVKLADFLAEYEKDPSGDYCYSSYDEKYPHTDSCLYAGYKRYFVTENGKYDRESEAEGTIEKVILNISAVSYGDIPIKARLWSVKEDADGNYIDQEEITGKNKDDYTVQFEIPYDGQKTYYRLELYDPDSGESIYETITKFNMD